MLDVKVVRESEGSASQGGTAMSDERLRMIEDILVNRYGVEEEPLSEPELSRDSGRHYRGAGGEMHDVKVSIPYATAGTAQR